MSAEAAAPERAFVPSLVAVGLVVSVVSALGAPLIPTIARDFHTSLATAQWSLTATLLVGAVASPLVGRLGDGPHRRTVLVACLGLVTLGGVVAALAPAPGVLIAGRGLQGIGLALLPLTMASARDHLPAVRAASVIALLSVIGAAGVGLGYPITGLIAERSGVAAAFWFGALASGAALVLAARFIPSPREPARRAALDLRGAALIGGGVLALLLALEQAPDWGWAATRTLGLLAVSAVLLAAWTWNELRVDHPLVELRLIRHRAVLTANASALVLGMAMYLSISLMTQVVQLPTGLGESVFVAGLTLLPFSACSLLSSRALPLVRRSAGPRAVIPIGAIVIAAALAFFAATGDALWQAFVTMGVIGVGMGLTFAAMPGLIVGSVPQEETGSAMGFYQVSRYVGFSIGSGLAVTLLRVFDGGRGVPSSSAYSRTFVVGAALCLIAAAIAWVLPRQALGGSPRDADLAADERAIEEGELGAAGLPGLE